MAATRPTLLHLLRRRHRPVPVPDRQVSYYDLQRLLLPPLSRELPPPQQYVFLILASQEIVEIVKQYHISAQTVIESPVIRGRRGTVWYLRTDVEALAVQLYGTRAFHAAHAHQVGKPCTICAITRFKPGQGFKKRPVRDADRKTTAVQRRRSRRWVRP